MSENDNAVKMTSDNFAEIVRNISPLVEAERGLHDWIVKNGIDFGQTPSGFWVFKDRRQNHIGQSIDVVKNTYSEALIFALDFIKQDLLERVATP